MPQTRGMAKTAGITSTPSAEATLPFQTNNPSTDVSNQHLDDELEIESDASDGECTITEKPEVPRSHLEHLQEETRRDAERLRASIEDHYSDRGYEQSNREYVREYVNSDREYVPSDHERETVSASETTRVREVRFREHPELFRYEDAPPRATYFGRLPVCEENRTSRTGDGGVQPRPPTEWRQARINSVSQIRETETRSNQQTTSAVIHETPEATPRERSDDHVTLRYADLKDLLATVCQPARTLAAATSDLPVFYGYSHENPKTHLDTCEERLQNRPQDLWKEAIGEKLKGEAEKWWQNARPYIGEYPEFRRCFLRYFADPGTIQQLHYELVNKKQGARESIEAFASHKRLLARRLTPTMSEPELVDLCLGLAKREVYREFVDRRPNRIDDFNDIASVYERLDRPAQETATPKRSVPKCRFCPGYHYHADCPEARRTRSGNANGVIRSATPNAASTRPCPNAEN